MIGQIRGQARQGPTLALLVEIPIWVHYAVFQAHLVRAHKYKVETANQGIENANHVKP